MSFKQFESIKRTYSYPDSLKGIAPFIEETVALPWSKRSITITRPADIDLLLESAASDPEQNLPYWAEIWPSGLAIADLLSVKPELVAGQRVFELGSGIGTTAIAALQAGAELLVSDYSPESLTLCRFNTQRNTGRQPETLQLNWRAPSEDSQAVIGTGFPVVLAADVLYESRDIEPLLGFIELIVAPGGLLILAEPGRDVARRFLEAARTNGWADESLSHPGPWPDPKDEGITVGVHLLQRGEA
jgi:predicted nicotinamide N-methyase